MGYLVQSPLGHMLTFMLIAHAPARTCPVSAIAIFEHHVEKEYSTCPVKDALAANAEYGVCGLEG